MGDVWGVLSVLGEKEHMDFTSGEDYYVSLNNSNIKSICSFSPRSLFFFIPAPSDAYPQKFGTGARERRWRARAFFFILSVPGIHYLVACSGISISIDISIRGGPPQLGVVFFLCF